MTSRALDGVTVLEFANYVSGPYAGMLLSDLGAEVIKVESPEGGDPFRNWGKQDYNGTFGSMNRNKKSVTLDLKEKSGQEQARRSQPEPGAEERGGPRPGHSPQRPPPPAER